MLIVAPVGDSRLGAAQAPDEQRQPGGKDSRAARLSIGTMHLTADLVAVAVSMALAFMLRGVLPGPDPSAAVGAHVLLALLSLPIWAAMYWRARLYSGPHAVGRLDEFRRIVNGSVLAVCGIVVTAFVFRTYVSRGWLLLSAVFAVAAVSAERGLVRARTLRLREEGRLLAPVIVVGGNIEALTLCSMLRQTPALGYLPVGFVVDDAPLGVHLLEGQQVLGRVDEALTAATQAGATGVLIATTAVDHQTSNRLARQLTDAGLTVELSSSLCDISSSRLFVRPLGRFPVVYVEPVRRHGWQPMAKRFFDAGVAGLMALLAAPILLLAALAIKLDSRGPVRFHQTRVGKDGSTFEVLKLRTMVVNAEELEAELRGSNEADGPLFKLRSDPRVTRVGRVLRALSIDELPQLWNVLRGEMSLVGPRPALRSEVDVWAPELRQRLMVRPGMTGMWQVSGSSRWHSFDEYVRLDLYYVDNWSIWTDLAILAKTLPTVLFNRSNH
jgi:exopolysaccharide biosynthesis polyprenyl glycosylphosphotransferase